MTFEQSENGSPGFGLIQWIGQTMRSIGSPRLLDKHHINKLT
jgi:hypothetical protein